MMRDPFRWNPCTHVLSIGSFIWLFTRVRVDDDYDYDENDQRYYVSYRQFVVHVGRLHIVIEWRQL